MASQVCPICNGLVTIREFCRLCGRQMDHMGKMEDYKGPYSPYMDKDSFAADNGALLMGDPYCVHIYYCDSCHKVEYKSSIPISI